MGLRRGDGCGTGDGGGGSGSADGGDVAGMGVSAQAVAAEPSAAVSVPGSASKPASCVVAVASRCGDGMAAAFDDDRVTLDRMLAGSCMVKEMGCREGVGLLNEHGVDLHASGMVRLTKDVGVASLHGPTSEAENL
ncbi:hypothetical protein Dimus_024559, partial [Dionaea muscipula]